jgi:hypothetical protein
MVLRVIRYSFIYPIAMTTRYRQMHTQHQWGGN